MPKIFILTIPGIGTQESGYSKGLAKDLKRFAKGSVLQNNFEVLECMPFNQSDVDNNQQALYDRLLAKNNLGGKLSLRKFVLQAFGDGVTFERNASSSSSPYFKIHKYMRLVIENANRKVKAENGELVIVASSMGAQILSTYIWDADHGGGIFVHEAANSSNNLRDLGYLATIGCNIPLFISGLSEDQIFAFDKRNNGFVWDNYYDADDVLGWPLKQISPSYAALVVDYEINTGLYVGSHLRYWDDNDFTKPLFRKLLGMC